jgi:CHAD domain-containing protein
MSFRILPGASIPESVRTAGQEQIDNVLAQFSAKSRKGSVAHETRKAMKRLRALLHLVRPAMSKSDFERDEARLKQIARLMSGVRDIQAMLETLSKLEEREPALANNPAVAAARSHLEGKRAAAERRITGAALVKIRKLLRQARDAFVEIELKSDDFVPLAATIEADYRKARRAFRDAYERGEDEAFHDWRKYVQRHWRQLVLIAPGWPRGIRPHIALARDLSEALGEDHDLFVLSELLKKEADNFGAGEALDVCLAACRSRQQELRRQAHSLGSRLLAEKPASLAGRLKAYWETAADLDNAEVVSEEPANVISFPR